MIVARSGHATGGHAPAASTAPPSEGALQTFSDVLDAARAGSGDQGGDASADPGTATASEGDGGTPGSDPTTVLPSPVDPPARVIPWVVVTLSPQAGPLEGEPADETGSQAETQTGGLSGGGGVGGVVTRTDLPGGLDVSFAPVGDDEGAPAGAGPGVTTGGAEDSVASGPMAGDTAIPTTHRPTGLPGAAAAGAPAPDADTLEVPVTLRPPTSAEAPTGAPHEATQAGADTPPEQGSGEATTGSDSRDGRLVGADVSPLDAASDDRRAVGPVMDVRGQGTAPAAAPSGAASAAAAPPAPPPELPATVLDQIVKSLRVQSREGVSEARIQLRPEHLGALSIVLKVEGGAVTAVIRAESADVQEWVLSHQQSLREQLEAAGLRLSDLTVSPDAERRREPQHAPPRPRTRRADGSQPRFEVVV